jgi:hypothetical protein
LFFRINAKRVRKVYKRIERFQTKAFSFNEEIEQIFDYYLQLFLKEFEYTLFKTYMQEICMPDIEAQLNKYYIANHLSDKLNLIPNSLTVSQVMEILDSIITYKLEECLTIKVPFEKLTNSNTKKKARELTIKFSEYVTSKNSDDINLKNYIHDLDLEFSNNISKGLDKDNPYFKRPEYFLLYRIRNNICKRINQRQYSIKHIDNYRKQLNSKFINLLYETIIEDQLVKLDLSYKKEIFRCILEELENDYLMHFRLGRTVEEGNSIQIELKNLLLENNITKKIGHAMLNKFILTIEHYEIEKIANLIRELDEVFKDYTKEITARFGEDKVNSRLPWDKEKIRMLFLGVIFAKNSHNINQLIATAYEKISIEKKQKLIEDLKNNFLTDVNYTVAVNINDLAVKNEYFDVRLGDIEFISNELFTGWQYEKYPKDTIRRTLLDSNSRDNSAWVLVHNIECAFGDTEKAVSIAKEKVLDLLNILYYFISKEQEVNYKLNHFFIVHNEKSGNLTWHNERVPWNEPKIIDDLDTGLIEFLNKNLAKLSKWNLDMAFKKFIEFCKTESLTRKVQLEKEIIKQLFGSEQSIEYLAACSAIIIAGSNYKKSDVNYREMRLWLYEDFKELLLIADDTNYLALKERIYERFKVFVKNIISTILFNMATLENHEKYTVEDILKWILFINKDSNSVWGDQ